MSFWTHIQGTISVTVPGRTQPEIQYILDTVLSHLPVVTGSERDMSVYTIKENGYSMSQSFDEFGQRSNLLTSEYGCRSRRNGRLITQNKYIIVVQGDLRDRMFSQSLRDFTKWLVRLSKRLIVNDILVSVSGYEREYIFTDKNEAYSELFEGASWSPDGESTAWWEYLMWQENKYGHPRLLAHKYYKDEENDKAVEVWTSKPKK